MDADVDTDEDADADADAATETDESVGADTLTELDPLDPSPVLLLAPDPSSTPVPVRLVPALFVQ